MLQSLQSVVDAPRPHPTGIPSIPPIHPIPYLIRIGRTGHISQWVAFAVFFLSTVALIGLGSRVAKRNRAFYIITAAITGIATLSYYGMATRLGFTFVYQGRKFVQGKEVMVIRQVFWARYVDWALTTPLLLLDLGLLAGLPWIDIISIMAVDEGMIITGLIGGLRSGSHSMWGWFAFSCLFLLYILYTLLWTGRQTARLQANHIAPLYTGLSIFTVLLWVAYPVVFTLSDGVGIINPNLEVLIYCVLDIMAKSVFGFWLVFMHRKGDDDHAGTMPEHWVEPRSHHRGIHLPGGDD